MKQGLLVLSEARITFTMWHLTVVWLTLPNPCPQAPCTSMPCGYELARETCPLEGEIPGRQDRVEEELWGKG